MPPDHRSENDLMIIDGVFQHCEPFQDMTKNARYALARAATFVTFEAGMLAVACNIALSVNGGRALAYCFCKSRYR